MSKKLPTSRRTFVKGTAATAAIAPFFIGRAAKASEPEWTLKCATVAPKGTPWGDLATRLSKLVTKKTEGRVKVKVYLGGARGDEQSVAEMTLGGTNAIFAGSFGGMAKIVPELSVMELPYLVPSAAKGRKVLEANRQILHDTLWDYGYKLWFFSENGTQDIGSTRPIATPADMKGLKIRTLESDAHIDFVKATGASAFPMGVTEVLPSLQTGVIDGITNTKLFSTAAGWTTAITHWTLSQHCWQPAVVAMSRKVYEKLPAELTETLFGEDEELAKLQKRTNRRLDAMKPQLLQNIKDLGIEVIEPDLAPWRKLAGGVHAKFEKGTTKQGKALLKAVKKSL